MLVLPSITALLLISVRGIDAPVDEDEVPADVVVLANGKSVQGLVLFEDDEEVVIRVGSSERFLERAEVVSVDSTASRLREFLRELAAMDSDSPGAAERWSALARSSFDRGLVREGRLCWLRVLLLQPDHIEANEALGHGLRAGKYLVKLGGKHVKWEKYLEAHEKWRDAWKIRTTHFELQSNLNLGTAIDAAFDLEGQYARYYDEIAQPLRVFEMSEPLRAEIHTRGASFRRRSPGEKGRFDPSSETLMIDANPSVDSYDRGLLFHEATHALLYFSIRQSKGRGSLPGWVDEGVAEYFGSNARNSTGRRLEFAHRRHVNNVRLHLTAEEPIELRRLLNVESGEFSVGDDAPLRYAQSYTLVHFLLDGEDGAYREPFFAYLRGAFAGKGSASTFKKVVGRDLDPIEADWNAHVRSLGAK